LQESRNFAWVIFIVVASIALTSLAAVVLGIAAGTILSPGGLVSALFVIASSWVASHLFQEAVRLGKLMKDSDYIMSTDQDPGLIDGINWSRFIPSGLRRD